MWKLTAMLMSVVVSLGLATLLPAQPPSDDDAPPPKAKVKKKKGEEKKKGEPGPRGDLTKAYDLLRRLRSDETTAGRPEERIRDWTERATRYYRDGLKAFEDGDEFLAHEYGAIAHDLARAADHARNAALFDRRDPELKPPPAGPGPGDVGERTRHDLRRAYDRITEIGDVGAGEAEVYLKAARDLYSAARRDVEAGREERGGELARSAEAMTHVVDHLGHAANGPPEKGKHERGGPRAKAKHAPPGGDNDEPEPKRKRRERPDDDLPPPLPSR
jgi:hypothetical protein